MLCLYEPHDVSDNKKASREKVEKMLLLNVQRLVNHVKLTNSEEFLQCGKMLILF